MEDWTEEELPNAPTGGPSVPEWMSEPEALGMLTALSQPPNSMQIAELYHRTEINNTDIIDLLATVKRLEARMNALEAQQRPPRGFWDWLPHFSRRAVLVKPDGVTLTGKVVSDTKYIYSSYEMPETRIKRNIVVIPPQDIYEEAEEEAFYMGQPDQDLAPSMPPYPPEHLTVTTDLLTGTTTVSTVPPIIEHEPSPVNVADLPIHECAHGAACMACFDEYGDYYHRARIFEAVAEPWEPGGPDGD